MNIDNKTFKLMNLRGKGHKNMMEDLNLYIEDLIDSNKRLNEKLKTFNKDEEIQKLKDKLESYMTSSIHIMSDKEKADAKAFSTEHYESCKGNTRYILEGTGIGTAVSVQCTKCRGTRDITDHDNW